MSGFGFTGPGGTESQENGIWRDWLFALTFAINDSMVQV